MMERVIRFASASGPHRPGEIWRRLLQAVGAVILASVVIGSLLTASAADTTRRAMRSRIDTICGIARVGWGERCEDRVANLAETANRVRFAGTFVVGELQSTIPRPQEAARDPTNPCGPDDSRALCTCKRELLDQQNGLRLNLEPQCRTILRAGRAHAPASA